MNAFVLYDLVKTFKKYSNIGDCFWLIDKDLDFNHGFRSCTADGVEESFLLGPKFPSFLPFLHLKASSLGLISKGNFVFFLCLGYDGLVSRLLENESCF